MWIFGKRLACDGPHNATGDKKAKLVYKYDGIQPVAGVEYVRGLSLPMSNYALARRPLSIAGAS